MVLGSTWARGGAFEHMELIDTHAPLISENLYHVYSACDRLRLLSCEALLWQTSIGVMSRYSTEDGSL